MRGANFVAARAQSFQCVPIGVEFSAIRKAHRIDDQMIVDTPVSVLIESVQMRSNQYFKALKETFGKFQTDGVCFGK